MRAFKAEEEAMKNTVPVTAESVGVRKAFAGDRDEMLKLARTIKRATWIDVCGTPEPSAAALQSQFLAERGEGETAYRFFQRAYPGWRPMLHFAAAGLIRRQIDR
jgi:hypothetical protein